MESGDEIDRRLIDDQRIAELISETSDLALFSLDADGVCTRWEPVSANLQCLSSEQMVGHAFEHSFPRDQREVCRAELDRAASEGRVDSEGWRIRNDGARRWVRYTLFANRNDEDRLSGYVGMIVDATREKGSSDAVAVNEQQFRQLVDGLEDYAIHGLDADGMITSWNAGAERVTGYDAKEIIAQHFSCFYTEEDRAEGRPELALATARGAGRHEFDGWRVHKDGTHFRAHIIIQPVFDADGQLSGFTKLVRDVSSQTQAADDLAKAREALDRSEKLRSLGELTGGIAHDFNNLLTVVRGSAELLREPGLPDYKRRKYVEAIVETADRAAELTGQLLSFGRRQALQPKSTDLNAIISEMTDMLRRTLGGQISVLNAPQPGLWQVQVDPAQLHNLVLNAAINARDAMGSSGTLTIATRNITGVNGEEVRLSISDTGKGMTQEEKARAFEPFFTTKPIGKGTGLGLSQAYGFAAQSGGRLELASDLGRGTTLNLYLPRVPGDHASEDAPIAEGQLPRGTRILLVEDSRTVALFAQSLLEDMGCQTVHAGDAEEALLLLEEQGGEFDVIFSDIVMPGISGLDLATKVRAQKPTLPILLATGYSESAARGEGSEFPILHKPYRRDALVSMLGQAMFATQKAA